MRTQTDRIPVEPASASDGAPVDRNALPLSFNQSTHLVLHWLSQLRGQALRERPITLARYLEGPLDLDGLQTAFGELIRRHEVLRTAFPDPRRLSAAQEAALAQSIRRDDLSGGGVFTQTVRPSARFAVAVEDVAAPSDEPSSSVLKARVRQVITAPFDYGAPPLMRATLFRFAADHHLLLVVLHHLVADYWSLGVVATEIEHLYNHAVRKLPLPALPDLTFQFGDFASQQDQRYRKPLDAATAEYWRAQWRAYGGVRLTPADLKLARRSDAVSAPRWHRSPVDADVARRALAVARKYRATSYMLCLTAMAIVFHAVTGRRRVAWWGYCSNRTTAETEALLGWFAQGRVIGVEVAPEHSALDVLTRVRSAVVEMAQFQDTPLQLIWQCLDDRAQAERALDDDYVSFNIVPLHWLVQTLEGGLVMRPVPPDLLAMAGDNSLQLWAVEGPEGPAELACGYSAEILDASKIDLLLDDLNRVLARVVEEPDVPVSSLVPLVQLR